MNILIKNAHKIITCTDKGVEIISGDILIEGNRIKAVGGEIKTPSDRIIDAKDKVVIPGLVNTHHHLYQTFQRNLPLVQDAELFPWLKTLIRFGAILTLK